MLGSRYPAVSRPVPPHSRLFRRLLRHTCNTAGPHKSRSASSCATRDVQGWAEARALRPHAGAEETSVAPQAAARKELRKEKTPRVDQAEWLKRTFDFDRFVCMRCAGRRRVLAYVKGGVECERLWSTWAWPRQVRGWPRREGPPRPRGVEAQAAPAQRASPLPRTSWDGGLGWAGVCLLEIKGLCVGPACGSWTPRPRPSLPALLPPTTPIAPLSFLCSLRGRQVALPVTRALRPALHPPHPRLRLRPPTYVYRNTDRSAGWS